MPRKFSMRRSAICMVFAPLTALSFVFYFMCIGDGSGWDHGPRSGHIRSTSIVSVRDQEGAQIGDDCGKHHRSGGHALTAQKCLPLSTRQIRSWRRSLRPPRARRRGLPWRCSRRCCLQRYTIFPTWRWPRRSRTGRASAAFRLCRDEETPERTAFVRFRRLLVAHGLDRSLLRRSRAISTPRAPLCVKARSSMPP